ncbi:MAG: cytochrome C [Candidatus Hydrogenedens sp.]|nr:cytochrome C [Candidatus Hydrogenedens sp.]
MATLNQRTQSAIQYLAFRNGLTIFGSTLATVSALAIIFMVLLGLFEFVNAAYLGIISFLLLPGMMGTGLVCVAVGHYVASRRPAKADEGEDPDSFLVIDLRKAATRRTVALVVFLTLVNIFLVSAVGFKSVEYSESVEFCGTICHTVMEPEYAAYLDSPHSKVTCAECHIGPGADWFVKSKISGVGQVFAVMFDTYHKPVLTPVDNLRPARDTCEECHWPEKFVGDRVKVIRKYSEDEANTELTTILVMHIGGGGGNGGGTGNGIHDWHVNPDRTTLYLPGSDDRQEIALVRVKHADGTVDNFAQDGFERDPASVPDTEMQVMDCIDCHNRPTHIFYGPDDALNRAMSRGEIDNTLPYIRKAGLEALLGAERDPDPDGFIRRSITQFYEENSPELLTSRKDTVESAIVRLNGLFHRNVFPKMELGWNTHPNNISHINSPGCFRCHDETHTTKEGKAISQDCSACHQVLAWDEENPQLATDLGVL